MVSRPTRKVPAAVCYELNFILVARGHPVVDFPCRCRASQAPPDHKYCHVTVPAGTVPGQNSGAVGSLTVKLIDPSRGVSLKPPRRLRRAVRIVYLEASSMMWESRIEGFRRYGGKIALFESVSAEVELDEADDPDDGPLGTIAPPDLLRGLGYVVLARANRIQGVPEYVWFGAHWGSRLPYDKEFMRACWCEIDGICTGEYLTLVPHPELAAIFEAQGTFQGDALIRFVELASRWLHNSFEAVELTWLLEEIGEDQLPITEADYERVAEKLEGEEDTQPRGIRKKKQRRGLATNDVAALCSDVARLVREYGTMIPAKYLIQASRIPAELPFNEVLLSLLIAWARVREWPYELLHEEYRHAEILVLQWLVGDRQRVVAAWLSRHRNPDAGGVLRKLMRLASKARTNLKYGGPGVGVADCNWHAETRWVAGFLPGV